MVARFKVNGLLVVLMLIASVGGVRGQETANSTQLQPTRTEFPDYVTGDECLFCHRKIGASWQDNPHQNTLRPVDPQDSSTIALRQIETDISDVVDYLLGSRSVTYFMKRSTAYGKLETLSLAYDRGASRVFAIDQRPPREPGRRQIADAKWDAEIFGERCAGCHTTAVETETRAFSSTSIDCFCCHGDVDLQHTSDPARVLLSTRNRPADKVTMICGQCHLRGGRAKSSGLPYPNRFVAGDDLLRDFQVDLSSKKHGGSVLDDHIFANARDVLVKKDRQLTCLSCHDVHGGKEPSLRSMKHRDLDDHDLCRSCHQTTNSEYRLLDTISKSRRQLSLHRTCTLGNQRAEPASIGP